MNVSEQMCVCGHVAVRHTFGPCAVTHLGPFDEGCKCPRFREAK